jgi:pyridoxamine 5'-phosphate oxidase
VFTTEQVIGRFRRWYRRAGSAGEPRSDAMALATTDGRGGVSVRMVLVKQVDADGFVFFTCTRSRKGEELALHPRAAATFHWPLLGRQVRIEGRIVPVSEAEADEYWSTRPRGSQLSAAVSRQSQPIATRAELVRRRAALERRLRGAPVPRPPEWSGYRIVPDRVEFWTQRDDRLHQRELFERSGKGWKMSLLQP